jgi:radical SAM superfamily enzyme YgiQ (UPF0313 family)
MKILLTCTSIDDSHRTEDAPDSHYPLGLAYLHTHLEQNSNHEVRTHFLNNVNIEMCTNSIKKQIEAFGPDVIGISIMTHSRISSFRIIEYINEEYPDIKVILGGIHPTIMWEQLARNYPETIIVIGEGELTFADLLERIEAKEPIDKVRGIAYFDGEEVVKTEERDLIDDLDILPAPKHEIFLFEGKTVANLLTSRGCPFKCNFCVLDSVSLRTVRFRSAENVCDEIEEVLNMCPTIKIIWLHDDAFMINKKRTEALCNEIIRRGIKTTFTCSARYRPVSRDLVKLMEKAGFNHVLFGLESGATKVMAGMKKGITKDHIRYATSLFAESNIKTTAFLISGLPGETEETINETIDFIQEMQYNNYLYYDDIGVCSIYPGAEVYTIAKEKKLEVPGYGVIDDDYWLTDGEVPFYECENSYEKLLEWKEKIRDALSLSRLNKPEIFLQQKKVLPSIIKYGWKFGLPGVVDTVQQTLMRHEMFPELMRTFFAGDPEKMMPKIALAMEKDLISTFMNNMAIEQKKAFVEAYKKQTKADKEILMRWKSQHVPAADEYVSPKSKAKKAFNIIQ